MQLDVLYQKALNFEYLTKEEGMFLFEHAPLTDVTQYCVVTDGEAVGLEHVEHDKLVLGDQL